MSQRQPRARRSTSGGSDSSSDDGETNALGSGDPDYAKLYTPGEITVSDREHRKLLEETDNADNDRVTFEGPADGMGPPEERADQAADGEDEEDSDETN